MKRLIFIIGFLIVSLGMFAQSGYTWVTNYNGTIKDSLQTGSATVFLVEDQDSTHYLLFSSIDSIFRIEPSHIAGGLTISATELSYINNLSSNAQTQLNGKQDTASAFLADTVVRMLADTVTSFVFGYGTGKNTDTLDCWDGAEIGAFLTPPSDSMECVSFTGVVTAGIGTPTVEVQFYYDVNLNDATPTSILSAAVDVVSTTSGTVFTTFANQTIPPNVWVWGEITTVSVGNKPVKLRIALKNWTKHGGR
jgi:hypothetical protein